MGGQDMKQNVKIGIFIGIIVIITAIFVVFYDTKDQPGPIGSKDLYKLTGTLQNLPEAIEVSDEDPFYALVATPVAVHYDSNCTQKIVPLYIVNPTNPSDSILRLQNEQLTEYTAKDLMSFQDDSIRDFSLNIAGNFWKKSDAAMIIENSQEGYYLGVNAAPIASYLSIPIIIADEIDEEIQFILDELHVKNLLICGDNIMGYKGLYSYRVYTTIDDIVNESVGLVKDKFSDVEYITLANPLDAFPPEVLDEKVFTFPSETVKSASMNRQSTPGFIYTYMTKTAQWEFTIPKDYKYALIEFEGVNHETEDVKEFGDYAEFTIDAQDGSFTLGSLKTLNGILKEDSNGKIIADTVYSEFVMYDCGGVTCSVSGLGSWSLKDSGKISATVTIKKLDHPLYPLMKQLSTTAPYLTAYHQGIVFAKPDFAFTADDDVINIKGDTCPGYYLPGRNPALVPMSNEHVFEKIHEPLNQLLSNISGLPCESKVDLKYLTDQFKEYPVYIALVGGATMLPRYFYQNGVEPIGDIDGDGVDDTVALNFGGGGTQSDNIYGNIDPIEGDWSNQANDVYSGDYPFIENIVGRIAAWDVQDANALTVRSIFYDDIIKNEDQWKDTFGNLIGAGIDFRKPLWVEILNHLPVSKQIIKLANTLSLGMLNYEVGPWKSYTGFGEVMAETIEHEIGSDLGFDVETRLNEASMLQGFSDDALNKLKTASLWNRLTFSKRMVKNLASDEEVNGKEVLEKSNFIWATGHGSPFGFGMDGPDLVYSAYDGLLLNAPRVWSNVLQRLFSPYFLSSFWGPGGGLGKAGEYTSQHVSKLELGPSFMWLESCFCGRITGIYPENSVNQAFIHAGLASLVASTTGSNIPGGYLEPKNNMWDTFLSVNRLKRQWDKEIDEGNYPELHFGWKIYDDLCHMVAEENMSVGHALRDARNQYLPDDAEWELWWSPPLSLVLDGEAYKDFIKRTSGADTSGYGPHLAEKFTSFNEYVLYGDPAFNPYEP